MYNTAILQLLIQLSSGSTSLSINVSDTTTTSEKTDVIRANTRDVNVSDTSTTSEAKNSTLVDNLSVSDSTTTSELKDIIRNNSRDINVSDTTTTSENTTVLPIGIYWDAASNSGYKASFSTYNWNHTTTGTNRGLVVNVSLFLTGSVTSVTYNSVNLEFIRQDTIGVYRNEMWVLYNPTVGTNSIVVTLNTSLTSIAGADSYTGVDTDMVEANTGTTGSGVSTPSLNLTTVSDQAWVVDGLTTSNASMSVSGGQTQRNNQTGALGTGAVGDKGPITPQGSTTMSWSAVTLTDSWALGALALNPAGEAFTASISVSDTTATSESLNELDIEFINVADSTTTSEKTDVIRANARDRSVSDTTTTSESSTVTIQASGATLSVNVSDTTTTSESLTVLIPTLLVSKSDTTTTSESVTMRDDDYSIGVSDTSTTSELSKVLVPTYLISTSDTTVTSEFLDILRAGARNISKTDTTVTSERLTVIIPAFILPTDSTITVQRTGQINISVSRIPAYNFTIKTGAL